MDALTQAPLNPFSIQTLQQEIAAYLDKRSQHINNWLFLIRILVGLGFALYVSAGASQLHPEVFANVMLAICYVLLNIGIRLIYFPQSRTRARITVFIDILFVVLLRHLFFFELAVDPNITMVGLFSLLLLLYTLYSDTILIGIVGLAVIAITEFTLLMDVSQFKSGYATLPSTDLAFRTQPHRVLLLMGYLGIVTLTTFMGTRRLEGLIRLHIREQQRLIKTALESSLERARRANLEELNELKGEFISVLSHELRTPLSPLSAALEILTDELADREDLKVTLEASVKAKDRLNQLINDYIKLAELLTADSDNIIARKIALKNFIPEVLRQNDLVLSKVNWDSDQDITISSDPRLLGGAITALLRRAASFTPDNEKIQLDTYREDQTVTISIKDAMSYLPPDDMESLDDLFYSSRERIYHTNNTGLELVLAQHSLKRIGSRLRIISKRGEGTTVLCTIPVVE